MVLGSVLIALVYHAIVYAFIKDHLVLHYIFFLLFFGIYTIYVSGIDGVLLGADAHKYFKYHLAEGSQMMYLFFYNFFIMKSMNIDKKKHPLLYWVWNLMIWSILVYAVLMTAYVLATGNDYHSYIFFGLIRLVIFSAAITLIWLYIKLKPNLFQRIIFYGSIIYLIFGFISSYTNYMGIMKPVSPIEWLVIGGFVDIIFFSTALNYRIRKTIYNLNRSYLDSAHEKIQIQEELIQKQKDLENERRRIALDMHDDLGSGLTKINYLAQKSFTNDTIQDNLKKIMETSSDLIENMSNIIWAMKEENDSLQDLMNYLKIYAAEYLESNEIKLQIDMPEISENIEIKGKNRRNIFLIIKEILHNMAKHSKTKNAEITINCNSLLTIEIIDHGVGFSCDSVNISKGNGLGNMKYRVESLGGNIECESCENGTSYKINIPLENLKK